MKRPVVCIDVDGTLLNLDDSINGNVVDVVKGLSPYCDIYIWSGGGKDYAERMMRRAELEHYCKGAISKSQVNEIGQPDITLDDQEYLFSHVNIRVE